MMLIKKNANIITYCSQIIQGYSKQKNKKKSTEAAYSQNASTTYNNQSFS